LFAFAPLYPEDHPDYVPIFNQVISDEDRKEFARLTNMEFHFGKKLENFKANEGGSIETSSDAKGYSDKDDFKQLASLAIKHGAEKFLVEAIKEGLL
jgi:hypothetical protein